MPDSPSDPPQQRLALMIAERITSNLSLDELKKETLLRIKVAEEWKLFDQDLSQNIVAGGPRTVAEKLSALKILSRIARADSEYWIKRGVMTRIQEIRDWELHPTPEVSR